MFSDTIKVKGFFSIERYDAYTNTLLDVFDNQNLVMDVGRSKLASMSAGFSNNFINKIVLGTKGHVNGNLLQPKTEADGFNSSLTKLFSQADSSFNYTINFTPTTNGGQALVVEDTKGAGSTVTVTQTDNIINYEIELNENAGNIVDSTVGYTEAGMFMDSTLFAMRTFPVRSKDSGTRFKIKWSFVF
jgi:hypothetical protein